MENVDNLIKEKEELNHLINNGIQFEIECNEPVVIRGLFGIPRRKIIKIKKQFKIEETTLSTLDRIGLESVELVIDEKSLKESDDSIVVARNIAMKQARRMARVVAIAVLGSDWEIPKSNRNGVIHYVENTKAIEELTDLFAHAIKPSQLNQLCLAINAMCNLSDFLKSTRLIATDRTTMPIRVEEKRMD